MVQKTSCGMQRMHESMAGIASEAVEVVRCRDCWHSYEDIGGLTCSHGICVDCIVREDFFCADGVKREVDNGKSELD